MTLLDTGEIPSAAKLKAKFPASLVEVTRVPGVGAKTARRLYDELGVADLDDLREAAEAQRIREIKGLGPKAEENILASLEQARRRGGRPSACCSLRSCRSPRSSPRTCVTTRPARPSRSPARRGAGPRPARTST